MIALYTTEKKREKEMIKFVDETEFNVTSNHLY